MAATNSQNTSAGPRKNMLALPEGVELGRYRILNSLGQGGFGITYLAEVISSGEKVVIKENLPSFCAMRNSGTLQVSATNPDDDLQEYPKLLTRFVEEARLLARLDHPNIVKVLGAFEALGTAYYVMPWLGGKELHKAAPAPAVITEAWLQPILRTMLGALQYLHANNIYHRDVKPANILLTEEGTPVLIDFGTARAIISERSATLVGSPGYSPIEQITARGKRGPWTDIYSLGATCYRLITGERPPEANERLIEDTDPLRPLVHRAELFGRFSTEFLATIDKALAIKGKGRWQTTDEWLAALPAPTTPQDVLPVTAADISTTPISVTPEAAPRKRPNLSLILLILVLALGIPGGYLLYQHAQESTEQRIREELAQQEEAERKAQEEAERKAREEAERKAQEEAERKAREEAERKAKEEAERNTPEIARSKLKERGISEQQYHDKIIDAVKNNNTELLKLLITAGADINTADGGWTPLYEAAGEGHTECVKLLLAAPGIDVNKAGKYGGTPLYSAASSKGHTECVRLLLAAPGIDVSDWSPISLAVIADNTDELSKLLTAPGIDVNKADEHGRTPLHWAALRGHTECVRLLLAAPGIDVNKAENDDVTPLYWAALRGHTECVRILLAAPDIDVNNASKYGYTPLLLAADYGHTECVRLLLAAPDIDVNKADKYYGQTPLYWAAMEGHTECVKLLLAAPDIDVNKANRDGYTPLYWAAYCGRTECVRLLLAAPGIDLSDWSPISRAIIANNTVELSKLLTAPGTDVNQADKKGRTPLCWAASKGHTECVRILLAAPGINVNKADEYGDTPLNVAASIGRTECVKLLLAAPGIDVNKANKYGCTPLYRAAYNGHTECVKLLLAAPGIDVNKKNKYGWTPLYWAESKKHTECARLLRQAGGRK